jgi:PAS domain S-box-containing protein
MTLGILLFPHRKKERDAVSKALASDFPELLVETPDAHDLLRRLDSGNYNLVMCALEPGAGKASSILREVKSHHPNCPVMWYASADEPDIDVPTLAAAMRDGLDDYYGRLDASYDGVREKPARPLDAAVRQVLDRASHSRAVETALRTSERHYRALFENNPQPMWVFDPRTLRFLAVNEAAVEQYGYSHEEFLAMDAKQIRPPEDVESFREEVTRIHSHVERAGIWRHCKKDGTELEVQIAWHTLQFAGRDAVMVMANDVTELRRADRAVRESEARYRLLFESSPQPMWVVDLKTLDYLAVNDAAIRHYGYTRKEFLSMKSTQIRPEEDIPRLLEHFQSIGMSVGEMGDAGIWKHFKRDGTLIEVQVNWHSLNFLGRPAELALLNDVTERRRLEEQLRQAGRMEAIGRLAGGIAHDFNNLLSLIIGYSELLLEGLGPVDPRRKSAEEIRAAGQRAASLTRQLLAFSRKQMLQPEVINLNEVVERTGKMLRRLIGEDIDFVTKVDPALRNVLADPGQIEQVLLNLAVNARDAMPDGGLLTIETSNVHLDDSYARIHRPLHAGDYVMLAVSDNGVGMDDDTRAHIFEPFFTTKEQGKGTGLGLATVYGIVKQSDGYIWVYSEPGQGASFKIYLPPVGIDISAPAADESLMAVAHRGGETLMVVEDEDSLRELASEFLESCGYRILRAANGAEALEKAAGYDGHLDLLVTDVVMPGINGRVLAERLVQVRPSTKVLYLSGYTDEAIHRHGVLEPGIAFLQKPFRLADLARKAREVLDSGVA